MGKRARQRQIASRQARKMRRKVWLGIGAAFAAALGVGVAVFAGRSEMAQSDLAASYAGAELGGVVLPVVDVYKDPTCRCCSKWVEHLEEHGFTVRTRDTRDLATFKRSHGVPPHVESCHTALVDGYVLEGHVPAADVQRLLTERPSIVGLAVPGMPVGSPGMEIRGVAAKPYDVVAFDMQAGTRVFASYNR